MPRATRPQPPHLTTHTPAYWSDGAATSTNTTNDVGWEIDLDMTYPVFKYLDTFLSLGYFEPGTVYARPDGSTPDAAFEMVIGTEFKF